jgi:hypothetical protein
MNKITKAQRAALREAARNYTSAEDMAEATGASIERCVAAMEWVRRAERGETPRGPGRFSGVVNGGYTTMFIADLQREFARALGDGNVSEGMRIALAEAMERRGLTTQETDHA